MGYLTSGRVISPPFREAMRQLGYIEGQNLVLEGRFAQGQFDRLPVLAAELVQRGVDVLVVPSTPAARAAKDATRTIPIVMMGLAAPVDSGLVANLARPGGNLTGLANNPGPVFRGKGLALLKEAVLAISRVGVFLDSTFQDIRDSEPAAKALGITLLQVDVRVLVGPEHFEAAFATLLRERVEALSVTAAASNDRYLKQILDFATTHRLPTLFHERKAVEAGGFMVYYVNMDDQHRRAAAYVAKIVQGAKPADLPVEQPMKLELIINLKTAKALGITIPPSVLFQADEVIQ